MAEFLLPYRTDWPAMLEIVDYIKGSGVERSILDARFGGGETMRERLNALEQLGIIERADYGLIRLSERGDSLAYASREVERQEVLLEAIAEYEPYRMPLLRAHGEGLERVDGPWLERVWQVDMRLSQPRNRVEEARTFFLRLAESAGLGTFRRGVRGQPSRLELGPGYADHLRAALERLEEVREQGADRSESVVEPLRATRVDSDITASASSSMAEQPTPVTGPAFDLRIQVDISEWDLEKIAGFFDLLETKWPGQVSQHQLRVDGDISHKSDDSPGAGRDEGDSAE